MQRTWLELMGFLVHCCWTCLRLEYKQIATRDVRKRAWMLDGACASELHLSSTPTTSFQQPTAYRPTCLAFFAPTRTPPHSFGFSQSARHASRRAPPPHINPQCPRTSVSRTPGGRYRRRCTRIWRRHDYRCPATDLPSQRCRPRTRRRRAHRSSPRKLEEAPDLWRPRSRNQDYPSCTRCSCPPCSPLQLHRTPSDQERRLWCQPQFNHRPASSSGIGDAETRDFGRWIWV